MNKPPVRLCCGQRHWGCVCPSGNVMCCLCFEVVSIDQLNIAANGKPEDVCKKCAKEEEMRLEEKRKIILAFLH